MVACPICRRCGVVAWVLCRPNFGRILHLLRRCLRLAAYLLRRCLRLVAYLLRRYLRLAAYLPNRRGFRVADP